MLLVLWGFLLCFVFRWLFDFQDFAFAEKDKVRDRKNKCEGGWVERWGKDVEELGRGKE